MLSVLIVNWNTREPLRVCLNSLASNPPQMPMEVIIVDNASTDDSAAMVKELFPQFQIQTLGMNTGYAHGNNVAFASAQGDFLLTLNPDTDVPAGTLDAALDFLQTHPSVGVVSVRFLGPDEESQSSVRGFPTLAGLWGDITGFGKNHPGSKWDSYRLTSFDYSKSQPAPQPMGTFLLFRRSALEGIQALPHPFDEQFPIFFNEVDLLYRLHLAGVPCWYLAEPFIHHLHGASTKQVRPQMIWESHRSLGRYFKKHLTGASRLLLPFIGVALFGFALIRARGFHAGFRPQHHNM